MRYRTLGKTGLKVSEVGFGAWAIGGNAHGNSYGPTDDATSIAAVRRAVDLGCTFFDTADVYGWGHSESVLGEALEGRRDDVAIATKVGGDFYHGGVRMNFSPDYIRFAVDKSLDRLRTDCVDLIQLHNPPIHEVGNSEIYAVLEELQAENKVRHFGVSIHEPVEGVLARDCGKPAALQLPFNVFRQEWVEGLFPELREADLGVIAREPLGNGFLTGKYSEDATFPPGDIRAHWPRRMVAAQVRAVRRLAFLTEDGSTPAQAALRFVLAFQDVDVTIPGAKTPAQVEENLAASDLGPLPDGSVARVRTLAASDLGP